MAELTGRPFLDVVNVLDRKFFPKLVATLDDALKSNYSDSAANIRTGIGRSRQLNPQYPLLSTVSSLTEAISSEDLGKEGYKQAIGVLVEALVSKQVPTV